MYPLFTNMSAKYPATDIKMPIVRYGAPDKNPELERSYCSVSKIAVGEND